MINILLVLLCVQAHTEPTLPLIHVKRQAYKKQIGVNGLISVGLTATAGIYWTKGNHAYRKYQESMTTSDALHYWEKTQTFDRIRNICVVGAVFFIGRTIYFYVKYMDAGKTTGQAPSINLHYSDQGTVYCGLHKRF